MRTLIRNLHWSPIFKSKITWVLVLLMLSVAGCAQFKEEMSKPLYPKCEVQLGSVLLSIKDTNDPPISGLHPGNPHLVMFVMDDGNIPISMPFLLLTDNTIKIILDECYAHPPEE